VRPSALAPAGALREAAPVALASSVPPPADRHLRRVAYGLAQPLVGARAMVSDRQLLVAALIPVALLAGFCGLWTLTELGHGPRAALRTFYRTFALLAPLPSVLMASHYARMVVRARRCFAFADAAPRREPIFRALGRAVAQAILIAVAILPATVLLGFIPRVGHDLVRAAAAVWALHWIVVDAFDASRVDGPESPPRRAPWFARALDGAAIHLPLAGGLLRRFARLCGRLARPWHEELAVVEEHPTLVLGFALTTAALLATPVLNLFFRPIVIIGAVHVLGRLEGSPEKSLLP
jgi:hypothetical protein